MAKAVIGIHGLGNKPPQQLLEKWWLDSIHEGFKNSNLDIPKFKFELVYWSDLVYNKPENPDITDENDPDFLAEPYMPSSGAKTLVKDLSFRRKALKFVESQMERIFLNKDLSINFKSVSDIILHNYFKELDMYYSPNQDGKIFKQRARQRLIEILQKYRFDDIMLIGHSMGSIIAYDVLQFELKKQCIHTFVTIGSPLGLPFIRSFIAEEMRDNSPNYKITTPNCVKRNWFNFSDLEDKVAINFDLSNNFEANSMNIKAIDFEVANDYSVNGNANPHKSYGYLRTREFIIKLNDFLVEKEPFSLIKIINFFKQLIAKLNTNQFNTKIR